MAKIGHFNRNPQKEELSEAPQVEELLKNLEFHKAIQNITIRISAAPTLRDILVDIKEDIRNLFHIHILTIYLIDERRKEIFTIRSDGSESRFPVDNTTLAGYVAQKKRMLHIADAYNEHEVRKIHDLLAIDRTLDKKTGILTGQVIASPIMRDNLVLGVMEIMNKKGGDIIDDYKQIFLDEITGFLAKALFNHLGFAETRQLYGAKYNWLIMNGVISPEQMDSIVREINDTGEDISSVLMDRYSVSKTDIGMALSSYYACHFVPYSDDMPIPRDLLIGIDKYTLINMLWVPLRVLKGKIYVAMDDPSNQILKNKIEDILETQSIQYDVAIASDILRYINRFYYSEEDANQPDQKSEIPSLQKKLSSPAVSFKSPDNKEVAYREEIKSPRQTQPLIMKPPAEFHGEAAGPDTKNKQTAPSSGVETKSVVTPAQEPPAQPEKENFPDIAAAADINKNQVQPRVSPSPVVTLQERQSPSPLTGIISHAHSRRASDIHLEPDPKTGRVTVRMRIDGQFSMLQTLSHTEYETLTRQIKTLSHLDQQNTSIIQNGKMTLKKPAGDELHLRIAFIPTRSGMEDTVIHISTRLKKLPLELLGLSEKSYTDMVNILRQPRGLVLITGPADSGITTTLHACLENINTPEIKIWTAEHPIEIVQDGLRQVQIDPHKGFDFPSVLKSFFTADPDVIMASRIDDQTTAKLCMKASVDGCLVLGSLWAENIPEAIERCLDMETGHLLFADAMLAMVQQRLIKTLCPKCKEKYHPSPEEYEELAQIYGKDAFEKLNLPYSNAVNLFRPRGCPDCGQTGYAGRMCVSETLIFSSQIKRMIRRKESPLLVYQSAVKSGMTTLMQDGINKVLQGYSDSRHVRLACLR